MSFVIRNENTGKYVKLSDEREERYRSAWTEAYLRDATEFANSKFAIHWLRYQAAYSAIHGASHEPSEAAFRLIEVRPVEPTPPIEIVREL